MAKRVSSTRLTTRCHSTGRQRDTLRQAGRLARNDMGGRETGASFGPARKVRARQRLQGRRRRSYEHLPPPSARRTKVEPAQNATAPRHIERNCSVAINSLLCGSQHYYILAVASLAPNCAKCRSPSAPVRLFASTQFEMNSNKNSPVHVVCFHIPVNLTTSRRQSGAASGALTPVALSTSPNAVPKQNGNRNVVQSRTEGHARQPRAPVHRQRADRNVRNSAATSLTAEIARGMNGLRAHHVGFELFEVTHHEAKLSRAPPDRFLVAVALSTRTVQTSAAKLLT